MTTLRVSFLFLLAACTGKTEPVEPTEPATTEPEPQTESGDSGGTPEDPFFTPAVIQFEGDFAFDAATSQIRAYTSPNGDIEPSIVVVYGTEEFLAAGLDFAEVDEYCVIVLPLTSSDFAPWAQTDPTVWFGVDYVGDPVLTSCNVDANVWNPEVYGPDPVADIVALGDWGLGVGEISPEWLPYFETTTSYYTDTFVGARLLTPLMSDHALFLGVPIEVDEAFVAQVDGTSYVLLPPGDVFLGSGIATAAYRVITTFYWTLN